MTPLFTSMICDMCDPPPGFNPGVSAPILPTDKHGYCGQCGRLPIKKILQPITGLDATTTYECPNNHQWDVTTSFIEDLIANIAIAASKP